MTADEVLNTLLELRDLGKNCIGILVHHIIRNKISEIEWMLSKIENVPVVYYLHDFYTCCVNPNLMKNDSESCIDRSVSCDGCCYEQKKQEHLKEVKGFLKAFEDRITFVAPAEYTRNHWIAFYPEYADRTVVIPHQKAIGEYTGNKEATGVDEPLRLAFVGAQRQIKGWDIFKKVVAESRKTNCNYDFYYFGNGNEQVEGVESVNVDIATQGKDAMIKKLKKKGISAVFLVCVWGETYSYTTYESNAANCFIFAMASGGNIPYTVEKNGWGRVFATEDELIKAIVDEKSTRKEIDHWKVTAKPGAAEYRDNDEIVELFSKNINNKLNWKFQNVSFTKKVAQFVLNAAFVRLRLKRQSGI